MKTFQIGSVKWVVFETNEANDDLLGEAIYDRSQIWLYLNEMSSRTKNEILWHEVVEAINEQFELNLDHHQITVLGVALAQIDETRE